MLRRTADLVRFGKARRALGRLLSPRLERVHGLFGRYDFEVDLRLGILQRYLFIAPEDYERETQQVVKRILEPGMRVMDVGANVGFFSVLMADRVGPDGRVDAFEPYPPNFRLLQENLARNDFDWAHAHCVALSDRAGTAVLHLNPINDGGHSLGDFSNNPDLVGWDRDRLQIEVGTETIDGFLRRNGLGGVDFMKVDVEGAETLVLAGAAALLGSSAAPLILCEVGDAAQAQFGKSELDLRKQLYNLGYRSYHLGAELEEFGPESRVAGLPNVLFAKALPHTLRGSARAPLRKPS